MQLEFLLDFISPLSLSCLYLELSIFNGCQTRENLFYIRSLNFYLIANHQRILEYQTHALIYEHGRVLLRGQFPSIGRTPHISDVDSSWWRVGGRISRSIRLFSVGAGVQQGGPVNGIHYDPHLLGVTQDQTSVRGTLGPSVSVYASVEGPANFFLVVARSAQRVSIH